MLQTQLEMAIESMKSWRDIAIKGGDDQEVKWLDVVLSLVEEAHKIYEGGGK